MSTQYIQEFLVSLGFETQIPQLRQFQQKLHEAKNFVEADTSSMASQLIKWQAGIVAMFGAVATGAITVADKVAQADQDFRLFSMRMFMTQEAGKRLKTTLDALGEPIEMIAWDKELRERAIKLDEDQRLMQQGLGGDFEEQMRGIRDIRFEFVRFKVEAEYVVQSLVSTLFKTFGGSMEGALAKFRQWNDWIVSHLPEITNWFAAKLSPAIQDMKTVLGDTWAILKDLAAGFLNLLGILSGDDSLRGTEVTFDKIAEAIQTVVHWMAIFVHWMSLAEESVLALASGLLNMAAAVVHLTTGNLGKAGEDMKRANDDGNRMGDKLTELGKFSYHILQDVGVPENKEYGDQVRRDMGQESRGAATEKSSARKDSSLASYQQAINAASAKYGVSPALIKAVIQTESAGDPNATSKPGAMGLMQLMPGTAKELGVQNAYDPTQNIDGGTKYLAQLSKRFGGDLNKTIEAYNEGPGGVMAGRMPEETREYLKRVTNRYYAYSAPEAAQQQQANTQGGNVTIGQLSVNVMQPGATKEEVQSAVTSGVQKAIARQNQRDLLMLPG